MEKTYGLIGYPLGHSFSPGYFKEKFVKSGLINHSYELFPLQDINELPILLQSRPDIKGLNVTIPYKQQVVKFASYLDTDVQLAGVSNTLVINREENIINISAYNTDMIAFAETLKPLLHPGIKQALVLGYGGAGKAVVQVLKGLLIPATIVTRNPFNDNMISWEELTNEIVDKSKLIVQCTPVGLNPSDLHLPVPMEAICNEHLLYDLIYNPGKTPFLIEGCRRGAKIKNGLEMLYRQADESWNRWNS